MEVPAYTLLVKPWLDAQASRLEFLPIHTFKNSAYFIFVKVKDSKLRLSMQCEHNSMPNSAIPAGIFST